MGLTSTTVLALAVLCTVLLSLVVVWQWPRLAKQGWRQVVGRVGLMCAVQLLLFSAVGLAANKTFLFYGSWADLLGQQDGVGVLDAKAVASPGVKVVGKQKVDVPGAGKPSIGGEVQSVSIQGARSRIATPAYVYLPPEYFQKGFEKKSFPVTVVLTGFPGTAENLIKGLHYPKTAWTLSKEKKTQPMILLMMRPTVAPPRNTQCIDIPGGPQTETFFADDVRQAISGTYRVGTKARNWGFIGDSTGGYCALKIALEHPEAYAAGIGLSADYKPDVDMDSGDLFHGNKHQEKRADLLWALDHLPQGNSSFLVTTSKQGESNLEETKKFIAKVKKPARVSSITLDSGGHNFNTWLREIPPSLEWLSARLNAN
ncbi:alpha/beta hydrolase [Streptomyces sp. NPDC001691]|uniref:alpha/beta hydrolase n=1 Tax=unclassified Streptomyces TaxID=2593676 RepID=UPI000DE9E880|nr:alpha/beta hydrolase-fold protein [Streptomyces sp. SDr-06]RCH70188.1 esterase [Streptomyces sp. SDr-06]